MPAKKKPSAESDLMLVLLGLQMNSFTKEQVVECGAILAQDRSKSLAGILEAKGYLKKAIRSALDALVAEQVEKAGGDPEKSLAALPVDNDVRRSLLALPLPDAVKGTLMEFKPGAKKAAPDAVETVVIHQTREERYRIGAEIGRGGLGRVVAGQDTILGREVAIKEMLRGADSALVKRFLREGEIAGRLSHPNVIPVHDIGVREEPGSGGVSTGRKIPYFVMTRIIGRDLKQILREIEEDRGNARRVFTRGRLLKVFQDVCLAMAYAHDQGVIHRDLKPANVMVGNYGEVYVVDWGLAKVKGQEDPAETSVSNASGCRDEESRTGNLTREGDVLGTPAYMPPEQADGRIAEIDERSDIYSLGSILYEILTLRPPFEGATGLNVIAKVLAGTLAPPDKRAEEVRRQLHPNPTEADVPPTVPEALNRICAKAMSRSKAFRYNKASNLFEEIEAFLTGEREKELKSEITRHKKQTLEAAKASVRLYQFLEKIRGIPDFLVSILPSSTIHELFSRSVSLLCSREAFKYASAAIGQAREGSIEAVASNGPAKPFPISDPPEEHPLRRIVTGGMKDHEDGHGSYAVPIRMEKGISGILWVKFDAEEKLLFDESDTVKAGQKKVVQTLADCIGILSDRIEKTRDASDRAVRAEADKERMNQERDIAGSIQRLLVPREPIIVEGLEIFGEAIPAKELGGDLFDILPSRDGRSALVCLCDTESKDLSGSLVMLRALSFFRALGLSETSPARLLCAIGADLQESVEKTSGPRMTILFWDFDSRVLEFAASGSRDIFLASAATGETRIIHVEGAVFGRDRVPRDYSPSVVRLGEGDRVLVFSRGVTLARSERGEPYGSDRLLKVFSEIADPHPAQIIFTLLESISNHMAKEKQHDDITVVSMIGI